MSWKPVTLIALSVLTMSALMNVYQFMTANNFFVAIITESDHHGVALVADSRRTNRHDDSSLTEITNDTAIRGGSRHGILLDTKTPTTTASFSDVATPTLTKMSPNVKSTTTPPSSSSLSLSLSTEQPHRVAGLTCPKPPLKDNQQQLDPSLFKQAQKELTYWKDIPQDSLVTSPYRGNNKNSNSNNNNKTPNKKLEKKKKFLTFEPDEGGWNNIRMAMETAVTMAIVMGRTLVLPPQHVIYLLWEQQQQQEVVVQHPKQQTEGTVKPWNFDDFFHLESVQQEMLGVLEILTFQEFLERYVMTGNVFDKVVLPPNNRTDWNGELMNWVASKKGGGATLWSWWRQVSKPLDWKYGECVAVFPNPNSGGESESDDGWVYTTQQDEDRVRSYLTEIEERDELMAKKRFPNHEIPPRPAWQIRIESYNGHPTPVDASTVDRLAEMLADRSELCLYDRSLQQAPVLHVKGEQKDTRFLVPFYAMLFVEDWHYDLWLKRFVRDHLRYLDVIQCAAARVVAAVHQAAKTADNPDGSYDSMHIRRGDFQYEHMKLPAEDLYDLNTRNMFRENRTVFVATDEKNRTFFEMLENHYHLLYLGDFLHLLPDVNPNYYGMIDQLVASVGETFIGTYYSTFTGLINRVRGYHAQNHKFHGYENGIIDSYYYADKSMAYVRNIMREYRAIRQGFWMQEFPVSWRDLDHDEVNNTIESTA